jgi:hypothetical protein
MRRVIAGLNDPDHTATNGPFNRDVLEQIREADRDAWSTIVHRFGDRDGELRKNGND